MEKSKKGDASAAAGPSTPAAASRPVRIVVTGACGDIGKLLAMMVARGEVFGKDTTIDMTLVDAKGNLQALSNGVVVELLMCNLPPIRHLGYTTNLQEAFTEAEYIFLAGGFPSNPAFSRNDVLSSNSLEYKNVGQALEAVGNKTAKILVVAEPQNLNIAVISYFAPSLNPLQITGLSMVDHNRTIAKLAKMLDISTRKVRCLGVWGNAGNAIFPDLRHTKVEVLGKVKGAYEAVGDDHYLKFTFISEIKSRNDQVVKRRQSTPALTVANAAVKHMKAWVKGTPPDDWISMVTISDGSYEVEKGLPYSFPVRVTPEGQWKVVEDLDIEFFEKERLEQMEEQIKREKNFIFAVLGLTDSQRSVDPISMEWSFGHAEPAPCKKLMSLDRQRMAYF